MISLLRQNGFFCNKVLLPPQLENNSVGFGDIEEFISFLKNNNIKTVLYNTIYESIEDYLITEELLQEFRLDDIIEDCGQIVEKIASYNNELECVDFTKFATNIYFVLFNGFVLYYLVEDDVPFLSPKDKLNEILLTEETNIIIKREKNKEKISFLKEKLKQKILSDSKFFIATNKDLRKVYITDLLKSLGKEFEPLKRHWINGNDIVYKGARDFIEIIWNEHKYDKR